MLSVLFQSITTFVKKKKKRVFMDNSNAATHELGALKTPNLEVSVLELTLLIWIDNKSLQMSV